MKKTLGKWMLNKLPAQYGRTRCIMLASALLLTGTAKSQCLGWQPLADTVTPSLVLSPSLAIDGTIPYLAYIDYSAGSGTANNVKVLTYDGSNWNNTGATGVSVTFPGVNQLQGVSATVSAAGVPYVLYENGVIKYNGTSWSAVSGFSYSSYVSSIITDAAENIFVAFVDSANSNKVTVKKYDGSSWSTIGSTGFSTANPLKVTIKVDGSGTPYVLDGYNVYKYNGSNWATFGSLSSFFSSFPGYDPLQFSTVHSMAVDKNGVVYVGYQTSFYFGVVIKNNGSGWSPVDYVIGPFGTAIYAGTPQTPMLAIDESDVPYVSYVGDGGASFVSKLVNGYFTPLRSEVAGYLPSSFVLDANGAPYIAYPFVYSPPFTGIYYPDPYDNVAAQVRVKKLDGTLPSNTGTLSVCTGYTSALANSTSGGYWTSGSTGIASVGYSTGIVSGVSGGTANITYTAGGCTSKSTVTVNSAPTVDPISGSSPVCEGASTSFTSGTPGGTWSSSAPATATVNSSGDVTGVAAGTATITYTTTLCGALYVTKSVSVTALPAAIGGISTVCAGGTITLTNTSGGGTWSSSNAGIASIDASTGVLTGVSAGTATITYTNNSCFITAAVTINAAVANISGTAAVCLGGNTTLSNSTGGGTWSSSNTSVATVVAGTGVVSSVSAGTTTITYSVNAGCMNTRTYTVNALPGSISGSSLVLKTLPTTFSCSPGGGTWSSSNTAKVTIGASTGVANATGSGSATITYQLSTGCYSTKNVTCLALKPGINDETNRLPAVISLYPNPTSGSISVEAPVTGVFTINTIDGRQVAQYKLEDLRTTVTLPSGLVAGTYICRFTGDDGTSRTDRLIYQP